MAHTIHGDHMDIEVDISKLATTRDRNNYPVFKFLIQYAVLYSCNKEVTYLISTADKNGQAKKLRDYGI